METIELGGVEIRPSENGLRINGRDVHLEPKVMAVLEMLIEHADTVVSRQDLMDRVWAGRVVGEEVLTRCISALRTALDDDARNPRFIQTVPKKGYRLLQVPAARASADRPRTVFPRWARYAAALLAVAAGIAAATSLGLWLTRSVGPVSEPLTSRPAMDTEALSGDPRMGEEAALLKDFI